VVILYEYTQSINAFQTPPIIAGRLLRKEEMLNSISNENVVPAWLVQQNKSFYCPFVDQHPEISQSAFANREKVKSVAGVQLKVADEMVGVMFINYRRLHEFTHEKQIIETLASSAAVAIKNQRWLRARSDIERMVITTFSQQDLLDSILSKAVLLSNSETGSILLQDPHSKDIKLDVKASYDVTSSCHSQDVQRLEIREETISKVSREKRPIIFDSPGISGGSSSISILSIPLLYSNDRLLGVLTLESTYPNTLVRRQIKMVQTLVDLAVIGIQNVNTTERLLREKEIAIRGVMSLSFVHHINNQIGGLKERALAIKDYSLRISPNEASIQIAGIRYEINKILEITNNFLLTAALMTQTFREEKQRVHLKKILESSLRNIELPKSIICEVIMEDLPHVLGGVEQLNSIFTNLIFNAVAAMPNGGKLLIMGKKITEGNDTLVRIEVSDTGIGIKEEHLQRVFDYGFTTKDAKAESGLGLWITRYSIEHLGGLIEVQSQYDEGSIFTVKLPACSPDF
jgi:signal transduction histidine kinase